MTKKHFIGLADMLLGIRPRREAQFTDDNREFGAGMASLWRITRDSLADFCEAQSSKFDRARWLAYIDEKVQAQRRENDH